MKNFGDYTYFVYIGNNKSYGFQTYNDPKTGLSKGFIVGRDSKGNPIYKKWRFNNDSMRQIRVGKDEQDVDGQNAIEFLRNSPECMGNPNGHYVEGSQVLTYFKELNEGKDAAEAVKVRKDMLTVQNAVLALKGEKLRNFAANIGVFNDDDNILVHRALDFASNYPTRALEFLEDPSSDVKALVKKALRNQVFSLDGKQIKWEGKLIGADEDDAVSSLLKDEKLKKAIEINLAKFGG